MWALELAPLSSLSAAVESVGGRESERFSLAGGEVVVFDCTDPPDARWAAWLGPWNMAHGLFYAPQWDAADIAEVFSRVSWVDTPEGMTADPGDRFNLEAAIYLLGFTGVGTLSVESRRASAAPIPRWRGFTTAAGEIWRMPAPKPGGDEPLLLVTETAVATLSPWNVPATGGGRGADRTAAGTAENAFAFLRTVKRVDWTS